MKIITAKDPTRPIISAFLVQSRFNRKNHGPWMVILELENHMHPKLAK